MSTREVKKIVKGYATEDGAGVKLIRVLGHDDIQDIDPFLLLDAFGSENPEDYIKGFPMHPHRGIETITYLLDGKVVHEDSLGNGGTLVGGELQWMTAGRGILHEEMPKATKLLDGLQFWLNLPQKDKMTEPAYFSITPDMVKDIEIECGKVKLISGEFQGEKGVDPKYVKATMMDITLNPNAVYELPVPPELNSFVYILEGAAEFGTKKMVGEKYSAVIFDQGDSICIHALDTGIRFVFLAGQPLNESIAWGGPVVMNTEEELQEAFRELREGTFVKEKIDYVY